MVYSCFKGAAPDGERDGLFVVDDQKAVWHIIHKSKTRANFSRPRTVLSNHDK
jgi:hypothetical protein